VWQQSRWVMPSPKARLLFVSATRSFGV
jgi:hypothetical protein